MKTATTLIILGIVTLILLIIASMRKRLIWPTDSRRVTSPFGMRKHPVTGVQSFHNGIDIGAPHGAPIYAAADGTIERTFYNAQGGNSIILKHNDGMKTGYAHLSAFKVTTGQNVKRGDVIGLIGNTGVSTGAHLHFTVRNKDGQFVDPEKVLA
jgi:murein DD-endopeptidase MepM/ murein hydrolase activator NlpD